MAVYEGKEARAEIEGKIRNVFLWAAINLVAHFYFCCYIIFHEEAWSKNNLKCGSSGDNITLKI